MMLIELAQALLCLATWLGVLLLLASLGNVPWLR
jgi:hypothetical protein